MLSHIRLMRSHNRCAKLSFCFSFNNRWSYSHQERIRGANENLVLSLMLLAIASSAFAQGISRVSVSERGTFYIKSDATLWGAGDNFHGELGDGTTTSRLTAIQIASGVVDVASQVGSTAYLTNGGFLWKMGAGREIGDGTEVERHAPVLVASGVASLARGGSTFYIKTDGTLWGSGPDAEGQLGDGGGHNYLLSPVLVATNVAQVSASYAHTMFVKTDGTLWGTGRNTDSIIGDFGPTHVVPYYARPVQVATDVASVSTGFAHTVFLKIDGTLWGMGDNRWGQIGDGTKIPRTVPVLVATDVIAVAAGYQHTMFIKKDSTLWGI